VPDDDNPQDVGRQKSLRSLQPVDLEQRAPAVSSIDTNEIFRPR
jgi:hypothetical protein